MLPNFEGTLADYINDRNMASIDAYVVTPHSSPTLYYTESYLDGAVRSRRSQDQPIKLSLGDTLKGFSMGVEGMRIGERRKIYVHPELAYGKLIGNSPQELVIFEVEVIALE